VPHIEYALFTDDEGSTSASSSSWINLWITGSNRAGAYFRTRTLCKY
jgi:hypothetical protein